MKKKGSKTFGGEIVEDIKALCDTVERGECLDPKYTVRTVELDLEPLKYESDDVRRVRASLNVSQAVFAKILGTSVECVESWEQGIRKAPPMACRLLDLVSRHRDHWIKVLNGASKKKRSTRRAATTA